MSKVIKLTEKDLTRIVNKVINEQDGGKNANETPDTTKTTITNRPITLGSNLFKLGSDKINTQSSEFEKGLSDLRKNIRANVVIQGGASSVGGPGFDNQGLANRRAQNFIVALKNAGVDTTNFTISQGVVTPNTNRANSPEANSAQFVKYTIKPGPTLVTTGQGAIDNTAVKTNMPTADDLKFKVIPDPTTPNNYIIVVQIEYSPSKTNVKEISSLLQQTLSPKVNKMSNVTKKVKNCL